MIGRHAFAVSGVLAAVLGCEAWIHASTQQVACAASELQTAWLSLSEMPLLLLMGGVVVAWIARVLWLVMTSTRAFRRLPLQTWPLDLAGAIGRTGAQRVESVDSSVPHAFCAGVLRPRIFITRELLRQLRPQELDAVLLHEEHHRQHRDPQRYLLRRAAADVLFFLPLLRWWAEYAGQSAELQADRAALMRLGPKPLASALWTLTVGTSSPSSPGFHGSTELRAAQLLGDSIPRRSPTVRAAFTSMLGLALAMQFAWCVSVVLGILHQIGL